MKKKLLAIFVVFAVMFSSFPLSAFADGNETDEAVSADNAAEAKPEGVIRTLGEGEEFIMSINDEGFTKSSGWEASGLMVPDVSGRMPTVFTKQAGLHGTWKPGFDAVENVEILYYTPTAATTSENSKLEVEVYAEGKKVTKYLDANEASGRYQSLGTYNFSGKGEEYVKVYSRGGKTTRLTIVKFAQGGSKEEAVESTVKTGTADNLKVLKSGEEYIIGTDAPGFSKLGAWTKSGLTMPSGTSFWSSSAGATGTWYPYIESDDEVEVFYFLTAAATVSETSDLGVTVFADGEEKDFSFDLNGSGGWASCGKYQFSGNEWIKVTSKGGGNARITCVKFVCGNVAKKNEAENVLYGTDKDILRRMGMLVGEGSGITQRYMESTPNRAQAAVMYLRLLGVEEEVTAFKNNDNFDDLGLASWAEPYLGYLKAHPELGMVGVGDNLFEPTEKIGAVEYGKILLSALGYVCGEDYSWENTLDFAASIGIKLSAEGEFTVDSLAEATVESLKTKVKNSNLTLLGIIIAENDGIVDEVHLNGTVLSPELEAAQTEFRHKERPLIYNNDGNDTYKAYANYPGDFDVTTVTEPMTHENFLSKRMEGIQNSQISTVFYGDGVYDSYHHRSSGETAVRHRDWSWVLADTEKDSLETIIDFCRKNDKDIFYSFRINDTHDYAYEQDQLDPYKREHPEYLMALKKNASDLPYGNGRWSSLDYTFNEVRQKSYNIVMDTAARYDIDGIEIDLTRWPILFKETMLGEDIYLESIERMNNFMRSIRQMLDTISMERDKPILLAIYIPDSFDFCYAVGMDIKTWLEEDLIDIVTVGCHTASFQSWDDSVKDYEPYDVQLNAAIDPLCFNSGYDPYKEVAYAWESGVDGIYVYNMFDPNCEEFKRFGSPETAGPVDPTYATMRLKGNPKSWVKNSDKFLKNLNTAAYAG